MRRRVLSLLSLSVVLAGSWIAGLPAQQPPPVAPSLFAEMKWRNIGPYRAGRTKAAAGDPSQPYTFYIGMVNGGVWKTTDAGRTWTPIFDDQPTGSIGCDRRRAVRSQHHLRRQRRGAAAAGPRDRRRHLQVHRRGQDVDAPRPARRAADPARSPSIRRTRIACSSQCSAIRTARTRSAASSARPTAASTFEKVLYKDENTAARTSTSIRPIPTIVYATMWEARQGPWENGAWGGTSGGLFKSTDGGTTWKPMRQGLPDGIVNAELADRAEQSDDACTRRTRSRRRARRRRGSRSRSRRCAVRSRGSRATTRRAWAPTDDARRHERRAAIVVDPKNPDTIDRDDMSPTSRPTAARRSCRSRARPAATTTRTSG